MGEAKNVIKNTMLIAFGSAGSKLISFFLLPVYTSILTTNDYGTYDYLIVICTFLIPFFSLSLNEAIFRYTIDVRDDENEFNQIASSIFFLELLGILVLIVVMVLLDFILQVDYTFYMGAYVASYILYSFTLNLLRGLGKTKEFALFSFVFNVMLLSLNILTILVLRWGFQGLFVALIVSQMLTFLTVLIKYKLWNNIRLAYFSASKLKTILKYSIPLIPNTLCAHIINISNRLFISNYISISANGIYAVSNKFPSIIEVIYHYFYLAWGESSSRLMAKGKEKANEFYQSFHEVVNNAVFSVVLVLLAFMPLLFRLLVAEDFIQGFQYVPWLLFAMYFGCMSNFYTGIFIALKKTKVLFTSTFVAAIANIILNLVFIKQYGLYTAAISTLIAKVILLLFRARSLRSDVRISQTTSSILIKLVLAVSLLLLYSYGNWYKIAISIVIAVSYTFFANQSILYGLVKSIRYKIGRKRSKND